MPNLPYHPPLSAILSILITNPLCEASDTLMTILFCVGFLIVGPLLILQNKYLMSELGFDFPILIAALGQVLIDGSIDSNHPLKSS